MSTPNDIYFFNNQYDDGVVWDQLTSNRNKNYYKCLEHQKILQDLKTQFYDVSEFQQNEAINYKLNIPMESYTLYIETSIIPYYTKKRFLDKYGYNMPITMNEIFANSRIFKYFIFCQIGAKFFFGMEFAEADNGCYLIIKPNSFGIQLDRLSALMNTHGMYIGIRFVNQTDIYYAYRNKFLLFNENIVNSNYRIDLSLFSNITNFNKPDVVDEWTLYVSDIANNDNFTIAINASIIEEYGNRYVVIPVSAAEYIIKNTVNCKCYLVNEYQRADDRQLVETLPAEDQDINFIINSVNPIPLNNILIYLLDTTTGIKYTMYPFQIIQSEMKWGYYTIKYNKKELDAYLNMLGIADSVNAICIEWYEALNTMHTYDGHIRSFFELYDSVTKFDEFINTRATEIFNSYKPLVPTIYDASSFLTYDGYPDLRGFRLKCLIELFNDNPIRLKTLQRAINQKNKVSIRQVYHEADYPEIFARSVMNTSRHTITDINTFSFKEPMMFIQIYLSKDIRPSALIYVNGIRVNTEYIYVDRRAAYIYFRRSALKENIENVIEIEVFLYDTLPSHKIETETKFYSTGTNNSIPGANQYDIMSLRNLMFVDTKTNLCLGSDEISYRYVMTEVDIGNSNGHDFVFICDGDDFDYFMTNLIEFFEDYDGIKYAVRKSTTLVDAPSVTHKALDITRAYMRLNSSHRINHSLLITNTNNYRKVYVKDGLISASVNMYQFKESADKNRFRVYYAGKLLKPDEYEITLPSKYDGDVSVTIFNISGSDNNREVIFEYLPIEEDIVFRGIPDSSIYRDELFWFDDLTNVLLPEMLKVYVNGYRIPTDMIKDIGGFNILSIPGYKSGDYIEIYKNADDILNYITDRSGFVVNAELRSNLEFREYILKKG